MKALVTGGAGFIGSNLAIALQEKGHEVTVLDNFTVGNFNNITGFNGNVVVGDVTVPASFSKITGVDVVFHEAAITDTTIADDRLMLFQNLEGFRNAVEFSVQRRIPLVFASSAGVYGNSKKIPYKEGWNYVPLSAYQFSKMAMEKMARFYSQKHSIPIIGLRYFNVYGPGEYYKGKAASMIYQLYLQIKANKRPRIFKFGEQARDQVYVADVVQGTLLAAEKALAGEIRGADVFNIATGQSISFNRIIENIQKGLRTGLQTEYFDNPYPFYQNHTVADISKARKVLGYKPRYDGRKGIAEYVRILEAGK
jgi:ADP-L-glycero-D-manno-heptose 6-epimerase